MLARMSRFNSVLCWGIALAVPGLIPACSGGDDSNGGGDDALLSQAPQCSAGETALRIEGSIDGSGVNDQRSTNLSVQMTNSVTSSFDSPASNVVGNLIPEPQPSEVEIHLKWAGNVSDGQTSPTTGGSLVAPAGTAYAGQMLCITQGAIGFGEGGSEGVFKFKVTELRAGANCMGEVVPVDLRGCYASEPL
jgi:hypothetical protein